MTVTLYNNSSSYNTLYKSLTKLKDVTATIKGMCSIDNPALLIDFPGVAFNYFYVADWGRYYRVTNRQAAPGGTMMISGVSDPVQSFNTAIASLDVYAARCEDLSVRSPELADGAIPIVSEMQLDKVTGDSVIGSGSGMIVLGVI